MVEEGLEGRREGEEGRERAVYGLSPFHGESRIGTGVAVLRFLAPRHSGTPARKRRAGL